MLVLSILLLLSSKQCSARPYLATWLLLFQSFHSSILLCLGTEPLDILLPSSSLSTGPLGENTFLLEPPFASTKVAYIDLQLHQVRDQQLTWMHPGGHNNFNHFKNKLRYMSQRNSAIMSPVVAGPVIIGHQKKENHYLELYPRSFSNSPNVPSIPLWLPSLQGALLRAFPD